MVRLALALVVAGVAVSEAVGISPSAELTAASGRIVFVRQGSDNAIMVVAADGSSLRRVTRGVIAFDPSWSPDGSLIAFHASGPGQAQLFVVSPAISRVRRVTRPLPAATSACASRPACHVPARRSFNTQPAWSPDGRRLVFVHARAQPRICDLYTVTLDGRSYRRLTRTRVCEVSPSWSADGSRIAYGTACAQADCPIYMLWPAHRRRKPVRLTTGSAPVWSPDGKRLAYVHQEAIHIRTLGAASQVVVAPAPPLSVGLYDLAWSPDGTEIAYAARGRDDCGAKYTDRIQIAKVDGGGTRSLLYPNCWDDVDPDWTRATT